MYCYERFNSWLTRRALNCFRLEATIMETYCVWVKLYTVCVQIFEGHNFAVFAVNMSNNSFLKVLCIYIYNTCTVHVHTYNNPQKSNQKFLNFDNPPIIYLHTYIYIYIYIYIYMYVYPSKICRYGSITLSILQLYCVYN